MYHRDLKILGIKPQHANALWQLFTFKGRERERPTVCIALLKDGRPSVVTNGFRRFHLPAEFKKVTQENIEALAKRVRAKIVIAVEEASMRKIVEQVQQHYRYEEDTFYLTESFFRSFKEALQASGLILYPDIFNFLFDLEAARMERFFDVIFPKTSSMVFYLFRGQGIESAFIVVRGSEYIEVVAGHETIKDAAAGFYPWQKGYPSLLKAVKETYAPPTLGFFAELDAMEQILWYPEPGNFLGNFFSGKIIIDPMPTWVAAALGVDAVSKVARTSMDLIRQFDTLGITRRFDLGSLGRSLQERLKKEELTLESVLGFDPIDFVSKFIAWLAG